MKRVLVAVAALAPALAVLAWGQAELAGFIKDDAFITLRYARNVVSGHGFVFNPGEPALEGYSNFSWLVLCAAGMAAGGEGEVVVRVLSMAAAAGAVIYTFAFGRALGGPATGAAAALALASTPSCQVWAQGGLEGPLLALAFAATCTHVARLYTGPISALSPVAAVQPRRASLAALAVWSLLACLTRPEGHLLWLGVLGVLVARGGGAARAWLVATLPVLALYHGWRLLYFGDLLPNPYYVKAAGAGFGALVPGARALGRELSLVALVLPLALAAAWSGEARAARRLAAGLALVLLLHVVWIGGDEMPYLRLVLPALPGVLALAADGAGRLASRVGDARIARAVLALAVAVWAGAGIARVAELAPGLRATRDGMRRGQQAMAEYVAAASAPGDGVVFQDMGVAPFTAGALRWIDPIGVVERTVARARYHAGVSPFLRSASVASAGRAADAEIRAYLWSLAPRWLAAVVAIPEASAPALDRAYREAMSEAERMALLAPFLQRNRYSAGLFSDERLAREYRFERTWQRRDDYYVVLYQRRR